MADYSFEADGPTLTVRVGPQIVARLSLAVPLPNVARWWEVYIGGGDVFSAGSAYRDDCMSAEDADTLRGIDSADGLAGTVIADAWATAMYDRLGKLRWSPSSGATTPQSLPPTSGSDSDSEPTPGDQTPS